MVLTWNTGAERLYGYSALEATGRNMTFLLPPDRPDEEQEILAAIRRGERVQHRETQRLRKDAQLIHVSVTISPIRDRTGAITGASHVARDITERKRAEEEIRESEATLRAYLESAAQGVMAVEQCGRIVLVNRKVEEMFGYQRDEILGQSLTLLIPEQKRDKHAETCWDFFQHLHEGPMAALESAARHRDGTEFSVEINLSYVETAKGVLGLALISDTSQRIKLEQQLRQTQKLESLGVLAGGVAHDFNNLLTGILGNASLALETLSTDNPVRIQIRDILRASERASHLTRQLLAYAGKGHFVVEPINISGLVREISSLIQTSISRNVQLRLELQDDLPMVEADAGQLQQLIMNLVINGAEAIGPEHNGTVLVTTSVQHVDAAYLQSTLKDAFGTPNLPEANYVTLQVHDTGCGMDDETIVKAFDPFFTTKFTGRGLGLAAVQGIVRGHKGSLKVYSSPGQGSTFKVLLPASQSKPVEIRQTLAAQPHGDGALILVIDDEDVVRRAAKAMLERYGYSVVVAENGKDGVDLFQMLDQKVALVLLDMTMPVMGGEETLRHLRAKRPDLKVLLSSGYNEVEAIRRFSGKGLAGFVQKPYSAITLAEKVKSVLEATTV
jgi:PAS domain S-box-containing protein